MEISPLGRARGSSVSGLYGSSVGQRPVRAAVTELIGTAGLVYVGTSAAVAGAVRRDDVYDRMRVGLRAPLRRLPVPRRPPIPLPMPPLTR